MTRDGAKEVFKIQQESEREDVFKIQKEREGGIQNPAKEREKEELLKIQQEKEELLKIQQKRVHGLGFGLGENLERCRCCR